MMSLMGKCVKPKTQVEVFCHGDILTDSNWKNVDAISVMVARYIANCKLKPFHLKQVELDRNCARSSLDEKKR